LASSLRANVVENVNSFNQPAFRAREKAGDTSSAWKSLAPGCAESGIAAQAEAFEANGSRPAFRLRQELG
jgi:hypothetical protein